MTPERLREIKARLPKPTPDGIETCDVCPHQKCEVADEPCYSCINAYSGDPKYLSDIPDLLSEIERLHAEEEALRNALMENTTMVNKLAPSYWECRMCHVQYKSLTDLKNVDKHENICPCRIGLPPRHHNVCLACKKLGDICGGLSPDIDIDYTDCFEPDPRAVDAERVPGDEEE